MGESLDLVLTINVCLGALKHVWIKLSAYVVCICAPMHLCIFISIYPYTASVDVCLGSCVQTCKSAHFVCVNVSLYVYMSAKKKKYIYIYIYIIYIYRMYAYAAYTFIYCVHCTYVPGLSCPHNAQSLNAHRSLP